MGQNKPVNLGLHVNNQKIAAFYFSLYMPQHASKNYRSEN